MAKPIVLTASNLLTLSTCARKFYLAYELGWRKRETSDALRFGTAFHAGLEARANGKNCLEAIDAALTTAGDAPFDPAEAAKLEGLLRGYFARYEGAAEVVREFKPEVEFCFKVPGLRGVLLAGKIDGVVTLSDGRSGIIEHKTTGEDISYGSEYWDNINRNQIALYGIAQEINGSRPSVYLYDVIRKPTIRQTQKETPEEYGERLAIDCTENRPEFYFARREIPVLDVDREALWHKVSVSADFIRFNRRQEAKLDACGISRAEAWMKCGSAIACKGCPFRGVCDSRECPESFDSGVRFTELTVVHKFI